LGVDLTFGNSPSTVRQFRRVSSGGHDKRAHKDHSFSEQLESKPRQPFSKTPSTTSTLIGQDENEPPQFPARSPSKHQSSCSEIPQSPIPITPIAVTKESLLGRRAYTKVIDVVCQENLAQTAEAGKREALSRLATAWQVLDRVDPEGEFLMLKALIDGLKEEPKLAAALGLATTAPPIGLGIAASANSSFTSTSTYVNTPPTSMAPPSPMKLRTRSPTKDPTVPSQQYIMAPPSLDMSASKAQQQRLVLAQNNPHLKSHRRRQSAIVGGAIDASRLDAEERRLPGFVQPGMEQSAGLADVLYSRWVDGLRGRWGLS
jgi:serine/threonine-protein kinase 24/25/MST4